MIYYRWKGSRRGMKSINTDFQVDYVFNPGRTWARRTGGELFARIGAPHGFWATEISNGWLAAALAVALVTGGDRKLASAHPAARLCQIRPHSVPTRWQGISGFALYRAGGPLRIDLGMLKPDGKV